MYKYVNIYMIVKSQAELLLRNVVTVLDSSEGEAASQVDSESL